jgi:hypothetical protein
MHTIHGPALQLLDMLQHDSLLLLLLLLLLLRCNHTY